MLKHYVLIGQTPVIEPDLLKWAMAFGCFDNQVARTEIGAGVVRRSFWASITTGSEARRCYSKRWCSSTGRPCFRSAARHGWKPRRSIAGCEEWRENAA